jgi:FtsP/CotA-like multicopper oxidase with cupredoxin domain
MLLFRNGTGANARMNRRVFMGAGVGAALWAWRVGAETGTATSAAGADGYFEMTAGAAPPPLASPANGFGYNGRVPGPLLRVRAGQTLKVRLVNNLSSPTTLSFPGLRAANASLGVAGLTQAPVAPGGRLETRLDPPDAGFNLYLPHAGKDTATQIAKGLFGPIVVDEPSPPPIDLETVVVLCDWRLDAKGEIADLADARLARGAGRFGAALSANSAPAPLTLSAAPGARVRLRIGNAATARIMMIAIEGAKTQIIAVDGQPSEPFEPLRNLVPIGPGARFELIFDMPREPGARARFVLRGGDVAAIPGEADRPLIVVEAEGEPVAARGPLPVLPPNPKLPAEIALERSRRVDLTITGGGETAFAIGGTSFTDWAAKPAFAIPRGNPVTLGLVNKTATTQAIRLNGHAARLLHALDDGWEPYWRDILLVQSGKSVHVAFVADNPGKWPIESASPERRNAGLATWFQVL